MFGYPILVDDQRGKIEELKFGFGGLLLFVFGGGFIEQTSYLSGTVSRGGD